MSKTIVGRTHGSLRFGGLGCIVLLPLSLVFFAVVHGKLE